MAWRYKPSAKYGNSKVTIDGRTFDSKLEAKRYGELKLMERAGMISNLQCQVPFELIPKFKKNGKTIRKMEYIADFTYTKNDELIVEDTKGLRTEAYKIKRKLFEYKYPNLTIKEIER